MTSFPRRQFLKTTLATAAAIPLARSALVSSAAPASNSAAPTIVDTNVNLFQWPFRRLKYSDTSALVAKLRKHRVSEAWAGSFEALFHKDIAGVNERLARECREKGAGLLVPFGTVNLAWLDWEDDLRRCHEEHRMPGVRIYPGYQPFDLKHEGVPRLVKMIEERGLILQVVFQMEDPRVHHPLISLDTLDARPLVPVLKTAPKAKVELLHFTGNIQGTDLHALMAETSARIDISRWESNGIVGKMIGATATGRNSRVPLERVCFGSHAPYFPIETAILKLVESPLTAEQIAAIMNGNARALLPKA